MKRRLTTTTISATLSNQRGRAIVAARGHHFVADSPLALGGPSEEINPLDLLLAALGTCALFVCERVAHEESIPLDKVTVNVAGDTDPRGIYGEPVESSVQAIRLWLTMTGPDQTQAAHLTEAVKTRCPVYTTLARAVPIEIETRLENRLQV